MKILVKFNKNIATPKQVKSFKVFDLGTVITTIDDLLETSIIEIDDHTLPILKIVNNLEIQYYIIDNLGATFGNNQPYYTDDFVKEITTDDLILINTINTEENTIQSGSNLTITSQITFCLNNNIKDLNLIILSDSTGDQSGEWAYLFTQYLAETYPNYTVNFRYWDINDLLYQPVELIQTGNVASPKTLNLYLGGASGQGLSYGNTNFNELFPVTPDLVMISYGHNDNYANSELYKTEYLKLTKKIKQLYLDSQIILIGQNPKSSTELTFLNGVKNVYDIFTIAGQEGYGFINVMQRFFDYGLYDDLLTDGIHPNTNGSLLWRDAVIESFPKINYQEINKPNDKLEKIFIPANQLSSNTISLSYITKAGDVQLPTLNLPNSGTTSLSGGIILPYNWKTVNIYVYWTTDIDSTGQNVYFNSYSYFYDETELLPVLGGGAFLISPGSTAGKVNKTQIYSYLGSGEYALEIPNKPFGFSITRLGDDSNDTFSSNCRVLGILFERRL